MQRHTALSIYHGVGGGPRCLGGVHAHADMAARTAKDRVRVTALPRPIPGASSVQRSPRAHPMPCTCLRSCVPGDGGRQLVAHSPGTPRTHCGHSRRGRSQAPPVPRPVTISPSLHPGARGRRTCAEPSSRGGRDHDGLPHSLPACCRCHESVVEWTRRGLGGSAGSEGSRSP